MSEIWLIDDDRSVRFVLAEALRDADADVVLTEREGSHGGAFWGEEFPLMVAWAFGN